MPTADSNEPTLYHGFFPHGVDEKRRVQVPAKWRPANLDTELTMILMPNKSHIGSHILVLAPGEMRALGEKMRAMPLNDVKASALRRYIGANSANVAVDKAGRMLIPEAIARPAQIEINGEAVLVGLVDKGFEIWNPKLYESITQVDAVHQEAALDLL
jgi:MraZ protein